MAATGFISALATGLLICILGQIFLEPLAIFLGSTQTILPYTIAYLKVILLGAPWMCASFVLNNQLRFQGSASYAMVGIVTGALLNIALDPLLMFALDLGVAGAGWATILSQLVSFCLLLAGTRRPRRMAVLGDMFDLGDLAAEAHEQIGLLLNELKLECVVAIGQWMKHLTETARGNVYHFDTVEQACETLHREFTPGTAVLVKASHAMHFEKIVEELEKA